MLHTYTVVDCYPAAQGLGTFRIRKIKAHSHHEAMSIAITARKKEGR